MGDDKAGRGSYVERVRQDTRQYARDLLDENEKLRVMLVTLGDENASLRGRLTQIGQELERRREQEARLQEQLARVEEESRSFSARYVEVEQENSNLANLYVASYRLHGTVERRELLGVIQEVVANLIGSEETAIFELNREGTGLSLVASFGIEPSRYRGIVLGQGVIGRAAATGETWLATEHGGEGRRPEEAHLTACIPLKLDRRVTGAIALFRLLPQKANAFAPLDRELFELLGTQAAVALYCTGLHARLAAAAGAQ